MQNLSKQKNNNKHKYRRLDDIRSKRKSTWTKFEMYLELKTAEKVNG